MTEKEIIVAEQENQFVTMIKELAVNPEIPVDKIQQIVDMQEHIMDRNAEQAYNASMVEAQNKMPVVPKDKENKQTHSFYSSYEAIIKCCSPVYTEAGFSLSFYEGETSVVGCIRICVDIMHKDGHTKTRWADIPIDAAGIKGVVNKTVTHAKGSTFSYGRSYLIKLIFNIPSGDDDDGNGAGPELKGVKTHSDFIEEVDKKEDPFGYVKENKDTLLETLSNPEYAKLYQYAKFLEDSRNEPMPANVFKDKVSQINKLETKEAMKSWWEGNVIGKWLTEEDIGGLRAVFVTRGNELEAE